MFKSDLLKNKTIIITGGGTGLGKSMAMRFGELGANLVLTSRRQEVLDGAAQEINDKTGAEILTVPTDIRHSDQVGEMVNKAVDKFGKEILMDFSITPLGILFLPQKTSPKMPFEPLLILCWWEHSIVHKLQGKP